MTCCRPETNVAVSQTFTHMNIQCLGILFTYAGYTGQLFALFNLCKEANNFLNSLQRSKEILNNLNDL